MIKNNTPKTSAPSSSLTLRWQVVHADALGALKHTPDASVDAMVTDPPAGISFGGHEWDSARGGRAGWTTWLSSILREGRRTMKPGSHALVWAFPRTSHWTALALEDAGFEIRDCLVHVFAAGFAKTHDLSKAIDRAAGARRAVIGANPHAVLPKPSVAYGTDFRTPRVLTRPATPAARQWEGWGTALRPATEHWWLVRRPLAEQTIAQQVLTTGTGAINTKATQVRLPRGMAGRLRTETRTPTNLLLSHSPYCEPPANDNAGVNVGMRCAEDCPLHALARSGPDGQAPISSYPQFSWEKEDWWPLRYVPKVRPGERAVADGSQNTHPTVKPIALMRWLCRLVTPPGGLILDPFTGSGTTGVAALMEGFSFTGIERDSDYFKIAQARLRAASRARQGK